MTSSVCSFISLGSEKWGVHFLILNPGKHGSHVAWKSTLSVFFHQDSGIFVLEFLWDKHSPGLGPFILASNEGLELHQGRHRQKRTAILSMIQPRQARTVPSFPLSRTPRMPYKSGWGLTQPIPTPPSLSLSTSFPSLKAPSQPFPRKDWLMYPKLSHWGKKKKTKNAEVLFINDYKP